MHDMNTLKKSWVSAVLMALVLSVFVLYLVSVRSDHGWGDDFAQYIAQGASVSEGTFDDIIRISNFRHENTDDSIRLGPNLYPWGFPIFLVPIYRFWGIDMAAMKFFTAMFFMMSLPLIYVIFQDRLHGVFGLLLVAVIAFNPSMFNFKEQILSDFPFLFFTLLSVYFIKRFIINLDFLINRVFSMILLGVVLFISFSMRVNGILLLLCLLGAQVIEIRSLWIASEKNCLKASIYVVPYLIFFFLMKLVNTILPNGISSYGEALHYLSLQIIFDNAVFYSHVMSRFFSTPMQKSGAFLYLAVLPFFFIGLGKRFKRDYMYVIFIALTLGLFIAYPFRQGLRYMFPVVPFFLYFSFVGLDLIQHKMSRTMGINHVGTLAGVVILVLFMYGIGMHIYSRYGENNTTVDGPYRKESMEMFDYIRDNTKKDSVIIFFKPRAMTLYTGRFSAMTTDFNKAIRCGGDYAVIKKSNSCNLILKGHEREVEEVFSNGEFRIYSLVSHR
jgi:hypothetical protein